MVATGAGSLEPAGAFARSATPKIAAASSSNRLCRTLGSDVRVGARRITRISCCSTQRANAMAGLFDRREVLDHGERVVEVMQKPAPALVRGRLAKALRVALEAVPPHEQQIAIRILDAAQQLVALVPRCRGDDLLRFLEHSLEGCALARPQVQDGDFEDHAWSGLDVRPRVREIDPISPFVEL